MHFIQPGRLNCILQTKEWVENREIAKKPEYAGSEGFPEDSH